MGNPKRKRQSKHNRVYKRNDREIKRVVFLLNRKNRGRMTAQQIAKAVGLTRQTIYNHSPSMKSIVSKNERDILRAFSAEVDVQIQKLRPIIPDSNARHFYAALVFMAHNQEVFFTICSDTNNQRLLCQMIRLLYPRLKITWLPKGSPAPALGSERADLLIRIMLEIICRWGVLTHCDIQKADRYIQRLLRATSDAASNRLP